MINKICNKVDSSRVLTGVIGCAVCVAFVAMFVWGMGNTHPF